MVNVLETVKETFTTHYM